MPVYDTLQLIVMHPTFIRSTYCDELCADRTTAFRTDHAHAVPLRDASMSKFRKLFASALALRQLRVATTTATYLTP